MGSAKPPKLVFALPILVCLLYLGWLLINVGNTSVDGKATRPAPRQIPPRPTDAELKKAQEELRKAASNPRVNWYHQSGWFLPGASIDDFREALARADKIRTDNGLIRFKFDSQTTTENGGYVVVVADESSRVIVEVQANATLQ